MYSYLIFTFTYTFWSLICFFMDIYGSDQLLENKIGCKDRNKLYELYKKILPTVIFNVYIMNLPILYIDSKYLEWNNTEFRLPIAILHFAFAVFSSEILFYIFHRISHIPYLYKKFHKKHHELKEPIGMGALYTHPLDSLFGAIIPDGIGIFLIGANIYTIYCWIFVATTFTVFISHSNFQDLSEYHDDHHRLTYYNYGNGFFMDKLFGTEFITKRNRKKTFIKASKQLKSEFKTINNNLSNSYKIK